MIDKYHIKKEKESIMTKLHKFNFPPSGLKMKIKHLDKDEIVKLHKECVELQLESNRFITEVFYKWMDKNEDWMDKASRMRSYQVVNFDSFTFIFEDLREWVFNFTKTGELLKNYCDEKGVNND